MEKSPGFPQKNMQRASLQNGVNILRRSGEIKLHLEANPILNINTGRNTFQVSKYNSCAGFHDASKNIPISSKRVTFQFNGQADNGSSQQLMR